MQASEAIEKSQIESTHIKDNIRVAADWFHDREGNLTEKDDAIQHISNISKIEFPLGMSKEDFATKLINSLSGDHVDPVQQVNNAEGKFIGVIEYREHDGYYTFTEFNDISGEHTRGVCGECVADSTRSSEPFTRHTGEYGNEPDGDEEHLHDIMEKHIEEVHGGNIDNIETGATLASGTTIAGNTAVHLGNESFVDEGGDTMSGTLTVNGSPSITTGGSIRVNTGSHIQNGSGTNALTIKSGGDVDIPNGELSVDTWQSPLNSNFESEWFQPSSSPYNSLQVSASNRTWRLGSADDSGASNQHQMVFAHNNNTSDTTFGIVGSSDGGSSWTTRFRLSGNGNVEIPNGSLGVGTSPSEPLAVNSGGGTFTITSANNTSSYNPSISIEDSGVRHKSGSSIRGFIFENDTELLRLGSGGLVEILSGDLNMSNNDIIIDAPSNNSGAAGITDTGFVQFENQESSDVIGGASDTMAYDASEGFLFPDNIRTSGQLFEGSGL